MMTGWAPAGSFDVKTKLTASDAAAGDLFGGSSVGISGNAAIVGASRDKDAGASTGSAYLFTPEPSSLLLAASASMALLVWRKRSRSGFRA